MVKGGPISTSFRCLRKRVQPSPGGREPSLDGGWEDLLQGPAGRRTEEEGARGSGQEEP